MNLVFKNSGDFKIKNGTLKSSVKFEAKKEGDSVVVTSKDVNNININSFGSNSIGILNGSSNIGICGNFRNIHISGNAISFNGYEFTFKNNELYINGSKYVEDKSNKEAIEDKLKENEYFEYPLLDELISSISILGSAEVEIVDTKNIDTHSLNLSVRGSGTIAFENKDSFSVQVANFAVQGSGDIIVCGLNSENCICSVTGSGDIFLKNSNFTALNLSVVGSGDITGRKTSATRLLKNVTGSGDINGF